MRDCRTFLRQQEAMELSQGEQQGDMTHDRATTDQGYQTQNGTKPSPSKGVHICNDPAYPKI
jgi:hypothetical protein